MPGYCVSGTVGAQVCYTIPVCSVFQFSSANRTPTCLLHLVFLIDIGQQCLNSSTLVGNCMVFYCLTAFIGVKEWNNG